MSNSLSRMKTVLADVLGVDYAEINIDSNLMDDLAAESIDFMDIAFQVQQEFLLDEIKPGDIFPAFLREKDEDDIFFEGKLEPSIKEKLLVDYSFIDPAVIDRFESERNFKVFFDVSILVSYVDYNQKIPA